MPLYKLNVALIKFFPSLGYGIEHMNLLLLIFTYKSCTLVSLFLVEFLEIVKTILLSG